jgi:hypothetical protein
LVSEIHPDVYPWILNTHQSRIWKVCTEKMTKYEAEAHLRKMAQELNRPNEVLDDFDP